VQNDNDNKKKKKMFVSREWTPNWRLTDLGPRQVLRRVTWPESR